MPARRRTSAPRKTAKAASAPVKKSTVTNVTTKYQQPVEIRKVTETPKANRPEQPNLSLEDYKADFKVRWQIHSYEVKELGSDIKKAYEFASPYIQKTVNLTTETIKNLQSRFATVD